MGINQQQQGINNQFQSAFSEARNAYNALNQQNMARFGGGSSAGGAVGEET